MKYITMLSKTTLTMMVASIPVPAHGTTYLPDNFGIDGTTPVPAIPSFLQNILRAGAPRIVGGTDAPEYEPYAIPAGDGLCGATLIHEDILLTAAHCVGAFVDGAIIGGTSVLGDARSTTIPVVKEVQHPDYDDNTQRNDIMIVQLSSPSSAPIQVLNFDPAQPKTDDIVRVIGYGHTSFNGTGSFNLQQVDLNVVSHAACSVFDVAEDVQVCAIGDGKDSCQGDSGGPLLTQPGDVQVGIVSFGDKCGTPGVPGVYTKTSGYEAWIKQEICNNSANPPADCVSSATNAPVSTAPVSTAPVSTAPVSTAPVSTAPVSTAPVSTAPVSTAPVSTAPVSTAPVSTAPVSTVPVSFAPVSNAPVSTAPVSSAPISSAPVSTAPVSIAPVSTAPVSTAPVSNAPVSDAPMSLAPISSAPVSIAPISLAPATSAPVSSAPVPATAGPVPIANDVTSAPTEPPIANDITSAPTEPPAVNDVTSAPTQSPVVNDWTYAPVSPLAVPVFMGTPTIPPHSYGKGNSGHSTASGKGNSGYSTASGKGTSTRPLSYGKGSSYGKGTTGKGGRRILRNADAL